MDKVNEAVVSTMLQRYCVTLGDTIRANRKQYGVSIARLAKLSKVSSTVITDLENGRSLPKMSVIFKLANTLKLDNILNLKPIEQDDLTKVLRQYGLGAKDTQDVIKYIEFLKYKGNKA